MNLIILDRGFANIMNKIYIFYSIDLINSTKIKSILSNWRSVIYDFIVATVIFKDSLREKMDINILKILGDEVIFYIKLENYDKIYYVFDLLNSEIIKFQENYLEKDIKLKFKFTSWILHTIDNDKKNNSIPFFFDNNNKFDFIGSEMDEGFRIATSFARCGQTTISLELAYFILRFLKEENAEYNPVYYLGLKELKGVWNGKKYPILWYSENHEKSINLMNYEQLENCELSRYFKNLVNDKKQTIEETINLLEKIINEDYLFKLRNRIENILSIK